MKALTYIEHVKFTLVDKPKPELLDPQDAIVSSITLCPGGFFTKTPVMGFVPSAAPADPPGGRR